MLKKELALCFLGCEACLCLDDNKVVEAVSSPASAELAGDKPLGTEFNKGIETSAGEHLAEAISPLEIVSEAAAVNARPVSSRKRDKDLNLEALETLVVTFGPREAARQADMSANTVLSLAKRKGWKKASTQVATNGEGSVQAPSQVPNGGNQMRLQGRKESKVHSERICNQSAGKALSSVLSRLKSKSTLNLAMYSAKASEAALREKKPLEVSRKVKDVADIHKTLWPTEAESKNILQIGFIISGK